MRLSHNFTKTRKDAPADEVAKNAQLLIRAGFVHKEMAGAYTYLPLGMKVFNNIVEIIREEMNALGGQEMIMTGLQDPEAWKVTGRWDDPAVDVWFKTELQNGHALGLGFTHEEPMSRMMKQHISSYKDLPRYTYQFQTKFRNEVRSKSGIMRGREFVMKDMYSFSKSQDEHDAFYEKSQAAYMRVFERLGLGNSTYMTFASGGVFAKFSHEFQTVTDAGEDDIYIHEGKNIAINEEVMQDEVLADLGVTREELVKKKAAEVGNIFSLGTKFSEPAGLTFTDADGKVKPVIMGSYGIGPGRTMGVIVETFADDKGLVWPASIAPAQVHIVRIGDDGDVLREADALYSVLSSKGIDVLYDDRNERPGTMLADADLIGVPTRVVVGKKSLDQGGVEVKQRTEDASTIMSVAEFLKAY